MDNHAQRLPPSDLRTLRAASFPDRLRMLCWTWVLQVNPTPSIVYLGYVLKILIFYVGLWCFFCSFTPGMGNPLAIGSWALGATAFRKAVVWSLLYEGLGLGCSTGPMTGRFIPPIGGCLHFLRPGTTKLPFFPGAPIVGGVRRTVLDVAIYAAFVAFSLRALVAPDPGAGMLLPIAVSMALLGATDTTVFLAARSEHYWVALVAIVAAGSDDPLWIAGCKAIWVAIWFWAATSKLNRHFPSVIAAMLTNSPWIPVAMKRRLYRSVPDDLRPSGLAAALAHFGTVVEYGFPMFLLWSGAGPATPWALALMVAFHGFIAGNLPMGMPVEWNVMMVYGGLVLFGAFGGVPLATLGSSPLLLAFLLVMLVAIPLWGNFVPSQVSFLMSMRYYAGNWAYSVWLFRDDAARKLDRLEKSTPLMRDQLARMLDDPEAIEMACAMTPTFRLAHLQGRALHEPLGRAVDDIERYEWFDGEMIAGMALGWNFGDGHLHGLRLLEAIQGQCGFAPGELRVIMVESQPLLGAAMAWTIADAADGVLERGESRIADMVDRQPWPTGEHAAALLR